MPHDLEGEAFSLTAIDSNKYEHNDTTQVTFSSNPNETCNFYIT